MQCPICSAPNPDTATQCGTCATPIFAAAGPASAPPAHTLTTGTQLQGGLFTVGKTLGQGGFGITYLGSDTRLQRKVAIKEFFPWGSHRQTVTVQPPNGMTQADYAGARDRFIDEARTLAQFHHPGIVQVYTFFEENNSAYQVMEFVPGKTLQGMVDERGPLPEAEAVDYISKVGDALGMVHQAGIIHRDIKPENIIVTDTGRAVLLDFGIARNFVAGKTHRMTSMFTAGYAPLEQYGQQARFGVFTDVYALGATLYHLLTGQVPVQAGDRAAGVSLDPPHRRSSGVSRPISDAVMWAMEMKVDRRPQSVQDFIQALQGAVPTPPSRQRSTGSNSGSARAAKSAPTPAAAPPPAPTNPFDLRIRQILDEMGRPAPPPPPSRHDARITEIETSLNKLGQAAVSASTRCPGCGQADLAHITGQADGRCPLCLGGRLASRNLEASACPVCRTGRLTDHLLEDDITFCPVCRVAPVQKERRKRFGIALDLWWVCPGCRAEFDVLTGGQAKLMRVHTDPHGMSRHQGQTLPIANWKKISGRSNRYLGCGSCAAQLDLHDDGRCTLAHAPTDPHGVFAQYKQQTLPRLAWAKLAAGLPLEAGNLHCPSCRAEFDHNPMEKSLTLNLAPSGAPRAQEWKGKPVPLTTWYLAAAGKRSLKPGLLCGSCRTEFDEEAGNLKLVFTAAPALSQHLYHVGDLLDWHRRAQGLPSAAEERRMREELANLQAQRNNEHTQHRQNMDQQRAKLESDLAGAFKQSFLAGHVSLSTQAPHVRLKPTESVRWESPVMKLKQRTSQGMLYWDMEGPGLLVVTNERVMFDGETPSVWQRATSKVVGTEITYFNTVAILVLWLDGVQKPVGFGVPESTLSVTLGPELVNLTLSINDLVTVLKSVC